MKRLVIKPDNFPVPYEDCASGLFVVANQLAEGRVYFKSKYLKEGSATLQAYCPNGQYTTISSDTMVFPCVVEWEEF